MNETVPIIILLQYGNLIAEWYHVYKLIESQERTVLASMEQGRSLQH